MDGPDLYLGSKFRLMTHECIRPTRKNSISTRNETHVYREWKKNKKKKQLYFWYISGIVGCLPNCGSVGVWLYRIYMCNMCSIFTHRNQGQRTTSELIVLYFTLSAMPCLYLRYKLFILTEINYNNCAQLNIDKVN